MKRLIIPGSLILLSTITFCQIPNTTRQKAVDSLFAILPYAKGTDKVDVINHLALHLAPRNFDSSFRYASEALLLSGKMNYQYGKGIATFNTGNSYYFKSDLKNALKNYHTALRILEPFEPSREIGSLLYQLAALNMYVRNSAKVTEYFKRASSNFAAVGDSAMMIVAYGGVGNAYLFKQQTIERIESVSSETSQSVMDSALKYNKIAIDYANRHKDPYFLINYYNLQGVYYQGKRNSLALDYFLKAIDACKLLTDTITRNIQEGLVRSNLGYYYFAFMNDPENGYAQSLLSADLTKNTDRCDYHFFALLTLGEIDLDKGLYRRAGRYLHEAMSNSDTFLLNINRIVSDDPAFRLWGITQVRAFRIDGFNDLVRFYELTGDYKQALKYQKELEKEKRIQALDELNLEIVGIEAQYDDELKRQEIDKLVSDNEIRRLQLNRTRILFAGIGGLLAIALLIIILWIQHKRFNSERKALVMEQKLLRAQMNPHFIFNSLYSIQNFIVTEKPDKASIYLSKFARLVRNILDNSTEEFVSLEKEISTIENYIELQQVRYAGKFEYRIDVDDQIDAETTMIPPMLAQPFIENAIEHGIRHRETPGHIDIRFSLKDHTMVFEVEDDGVGRQKALELETRYEPGHRSMATSLTRERLANLNRKLSRKIFLEILDLKNSLGEAAGTRVTFGIPFSIR
ncbi:MAG: sensor histidine kinase [Lentimicrobium sp.]